MNLSRIFIAFLAIISISSGQSEADKEKPKPKWMPAPIERSEELTKDIDAKPIIVAFGKAYGQAESVLDKKYAIDDLAKCRNKKAATTLEKILLKEKDAVLRAHAALGLARMAMPESESSLLKALRARVNKDEDDVLENVGTALGQLGDKSLYSKVVGEFEGFGKGGKSSLILLFGYRRDESALNLLADWLDEPKPDNPDSTSNPPADYWKRRFAEYHYCRDEVVWAMWRITDEIFKSEEDYRKWLTKRKEKSSSERTGVMRRD